MDSAIGRDRHSASAERVDSSSVLHSEAQARAAQPEPAAARLRLAQIVSTVICQPD